MTFADLLEGMIVNVNCVMVTGNLTKLSKQQIMNYEVCVRVKTARGFVSQANNCLRQNYHIVTMGWFTRQFVDSSVVAAWSLECAVGKRLNYIFD